MPAARQGEPASTRAGYRTLAVIALNAALLLVLLNAGAAVLLRLLPGPEPGSLGYGMERLERVYPDSSPDEIRQVIRETWSRQYVYEPFTQFKEGEFQGEHLNISSRGYRQGAEPAPWPPDPDGWNVFVFGGSTTFGYGLSDGETLPAALERELRGRGCAAARVYNFARSNYYSSQERILFEQLLLAGGEPALAIFVDGLNEFFYFEDEPKFTRRLAYLMSETGGQTTRRAVARLPLVRLLRRWLSADEDRQEPAAVGGSTDETAARVLDRWFANRRLIEAAAGAHGTKTLFVWQPVPVYGYDLEHHLFHDAAVPLTRQPHLLAAGYRSMQDRIDDSEERATPGNLLWLADLQRGRAEPLYLDRVHYTAAFSHEIARRIADHLEILLPPSAGGCGPAADGSAMGPS